MSCATGAPLKFGPVRGHIALDAHVLRMASEFAAEHYKAEEATGFAGENVEVFENPTWAPKRESWIPVDELKALGYRATSSGYGEEMVVTRGVDQHVDDAHGPVLCLVLHNDGLTFRQGSASHKTRAGEWFIFHDRANHGVKEIRGAAAYVALTVPLDLRFMRRESEGIEVEEGR